MPHIFEIFELLFVIRVHYVIGYFFADQRLHWELRYLIFDDKIRNTCRVRLDATLIIISIFEYSVLADLVRHCMFMAPWVVVKPQRPMLCLNTVHILHAARRRDASTSRRQLRQESPNTKTCWRQPLLSLCAEVECCLGRRTTLSCCHPEGNHFCLVTLSSKPHRAWIIYW